MFNKELEAGMLALNIRLDNMQSDIKVLINIMQDVQSKLAESAIPQKLEDSPFKTKEGLYNYKHRKPKPTE